MKIYVAYEKGNDQEPIGILLADTEEKAWLSFTAMKEDPSHIEELSISNLKRDCDFGVVFLLTSEKRKIKHPGMEHSHSSHIYRKWRRGLK